MKLLNPRIHGYIDYVAVVGLALAPTLFGFMGVPATICYVLAAVQLGMSLITAYPVSVAKVIPFTVHGGIELLTALFLLAAPWIFAFADVLAARNFFIAAGVGLFLVYLVTDYKAAGAESSAHFASQGRNVTSHV
ncbi:MAG: hypothetical protein QM767_26230 [Anaeromyxobacter sp.]